MNAKLTAEIKKLVLENARPGMILRRILEHEDHGKMNRFWLLKELRDLFHLDMETAIRTGGWNYWDSSGFEDAELDELLAGKLILRTAKRVTAFTCHPLRRSRPL